MAVFPFPQLAELREKYTYNITPFPTSNGRFVTSTTELRQCCFLCVKLSLANATFLSHQQWRRWHGRLGER